MSLKRLLRSRAALLVAAAAAAALTTATLLIGPSVNGARSQPRLVHVEPSEFAPVVVFEQYGERCLNFEEMEGEGRQSCVQLDDPRRMVFEYTRMMTGAVLAKPDAKSVLIVGLGGGTLPTALHELLPDAQIDTVEIDPAVVKVAQTYFDYRPGPRQRIHVEDGRAFVQAALRAGRTYDMVMLDAFDVDYIPAHLLTVEFLQEVSQVLAPGGLVVANSFAQSHTRARESATYAAVFGRFYNLNAWLEGNRIIIAANDPLPQTAFIEQNARALAKRLAPYGIDATEVAARFVLSPSDAGEGAEPLRD